MSITKRYVHPQEYNTRAAIEKARLALGGPQFWAQSDFEHAGTILKSGCK